MKAHGIGPAVWNSLGSLLNIPVPRTARGDYPYSSRYYQAIDAITCGKRQLIKCTARPAGPCPGCKAENERRTARPFP